MKPKISIITVSYNAEAHIEDAIKSVLEQSYQNKEYIIIDGGSKDRTLSIISKYKDKIDVLISESDNGISDAFNKGITHATGDIIGICNADDMLVDNALLYIADDYADGIDIFRFQEYIYNPFSGEKKLIKPTNLPAIPIQKHLLHMGCWIKKDAFEKYGYYDINFKYCMDYELLRRFISKGAKQKFCNKPVGIFRLGGVSQSNPHAVETEKKIICKRYGGGIFGAYIWIYYDRIKSFVKKVIVKN